MFVRKKYKKLCQMRIDHLCITFLRWLLAKVFTIWLAYNSRQYNKGFVTTVTGKSLAHFFSIFFLGPLGAGGQLWNWSILWNGVLQLLDFWRDIFNSFWAILVWVEITRKPLKISLRKKSGSWRTPLHKIDQFQNWSFYPRGGGPRKNSRKNVKDFCQSL